MEPVTIIVIVISSITTLCTSYLLNSRCTEIRTPCFTCKRKLKEDNNQQVDNQQL